MQYILGLGIAGVILYFLVIGGILIWPLINLIAYLKVLIFPQAIRKKYGSSIKTLAASDFEKEITSDDHNRIRSLNNHITSIEKKLKETIANKQNSLGTLRKELSGLGKLSRNKDGSISQRSNAGKQAVSLNQKIDSIEREIASQKNRIESEINSTKHSIEEIELKPTRAWGNWALRYGRYKGNRDSLLFMVVGFPVFFLIVVQFNLLGLKFPTFENILEIYVYVTFVAPVSDILDVSLFKNEFFSLFVSHEYALELTRNYDKVYSFYNWMVMTTPMPILVLILYFISREVHIKKTLHLQPSAPA